MFSPAPPDRREPDTKSGRRTPCPICGRTRDGDCKFSDEMAWCHHGSNHAPPMGLRPGEVITGKDGNCWAFVREGQGISGGCSTFVADRELPDRPHLPRPHLHAVPAPVVPAPAPITGPIKLAALSGADLLDGITTLSNGADLHYADHLVVQRRQTPAKDGGKAGKVFVPHHLNGSSPNFSKGAGPDLWPLWHQSDVEALWPGEWVIEAEGEVCANYARMGGVVAISQPGHDHKLETITARYASLVEVKAGGVIYLADNDKTGRDKADRCAMAAATAGLPFLVVNASDLNPDLPAGGSIDDLCRAADHKSRPGLGVPPAVAIGLILEHAQQQLSTPEPLPTEADDLDEPDDSGLSVGEQLDLSERLAEGRILFTLEALLPPDLAAAVQLLQRPLPTDDLSAALPVLCGFTGLAKLGTRIQSSLSYSVPINMFFGAVMRSGGAKTPIKHTLVDNPAREIRKAAARSHRSEVEAWKALDKGERSPEPPRPIFPHLTDYTPAALSQQLQLHEERGLGLLILVDELGGLLQVMSQDTKHGSGAADRQLLEAFDGEGFNSIRVGERPRSYEACHISVYGNIQPAVLKDLINGDDPTGKYARFLFCRVPAKVMQLTDHDPSEQELELHAAAEQTLRDYADRIYAMPPRTYQLDHEGRSRFHAWFHRHQARAMLSGIAPVISALYGKASAHALRIAGALHLLQVAAGNAQPSDRIASTTVDMAMAITDQLLAETEAFHEAPETAACSALRHIHELSFNTSKAVSLQDCRAAGGRAVRKELTAKVFTDSLEELELRNYGQIQRERRANGKTTVLYMATREMA